MDIKQQLIFLIQTVKKENTKENWLILIKQKCFLMMNISVNVKGYT